MDEANLDAIKDKKVLDFMTNGMWNVGLFNQLLPSVITNKISTLAPSSVSAEDDVLIWNLNSSGKFSLTSTIDFQRNGRVLQAETNSSWTKIWKWQGPRRIRTFSWLTMRDRLLTNHERSI